MGFEPTTTGLTIRDSRRRWGVVRITGSDNDQTLARAYNILSLSKDYRTFQGFILDMATTYIDEPDYWTIDKCYFGTPKNTQTLLIFEAQQSNNTIKNSIFMTGGNGNNDALQFTHSLPIDNTSNLVDNCIIRGYIGILILRIGGITIKNAILLGMIVLFGTRKH